MKTKQTDAGSAFIIKDLRQAIERKNAENEFLRAQNLQLAIALAKIRAILAKCAGN